MHQIRRSTGAVVALGVSFSLLFVGCASPSSQEPVGADQTEEISTEPAAPAASVGGDVAQAGFPVDFGCGDALRLSLPLGEGLLPSSITTETDTELLCVMSSDPDATILEGSDLDLLVNVKYHEHQTAAKAAKYCETARTTSSALDDIDGCVIDGITSPNGIQATIPFFDIRVDFSCEASTECSPAIPVDEETALGAIERIGLVLHQG